MFVYSAQQRHAGATKETESQLLYALLGMYSSVFHIAPPSRDCPEDKWDLSDLSMHCASDGGRTAVVHLFYLVGLTSEEDALGWECETWGRKNTYVVLVGNPEGNNH